MSDLRGLQIANILAVPGTGHNRRRYKQFRAPRHHTIKRAMLAANIVLRGASVPPSAWDDINRSSQHDRNWKHFRKTRWHRIAQA